MLQQHFIHFHLPFLSPCLTESRTHCVFRIVIASIRLFILLHYLNSSLFFFTSVLLPSHLRHFMLLSPIFHFSLFIFVPLTALLLLDILSDKNPLLVRFRTQTYLFSQSSIRVYLESQFKILI